MSQPPWPPPVRRRTSAPVWLWLMVLLTIGTLAFVPPVVIAARVRTYRSWLWTAGIGIAEVLGFMAVGADDDGPLANIGTGVVLLTGLTSVGYTIAMGPRYRAAASPATGPVASAPAFDANAAAVSGALASRKRRAEARDLAARDPDLARELRIGRPDLPRQYDDGGLVDVNGAPEAVLVQALGLSPAQSAGVVAARERLGGFELVDDLVNLAGLESPVYERVRDHVVVL